MFRLIKQILKLPGVMLTQIERLNQLQKEVEYMQVVQRAQTNTIVEIYEKLESIIEIKIPPGSEVN